MESEIKKFVSAYLPKIEGTKHALLMLDNAGTIKYANSNAVKLFNKEKRSDLVSASFSSLMHKEIRPFSPVTKEMVELRNGEIFDRVPFSISVNGKTGLDTGFLPLFDFKNTQCGWITIFKNNFNSTKANPLKDHDIIRYLVESKGKDEVCIIHDCMTGEILFASDSFTTLTGCDVKELEFGGILFFYSIILNPDAAYISELKKIKTQNQINTPITWATDLRKKDKTIIPVEIETRIMRRTESNSMLKISFIREKKQADVGDHAEEMKQQKELSPREKDVVEFLMEGHSSKIIADMLKLKENYINAIRKRLLKKYEVTNCTQLVNLLLQKKHHLRRNRP